MSLDRFDRLITDSLLNKNWAPSMIFITMDDSNLETLLRRRAELNFSSSSAQSILTLKDDYYIEINLNAGLRLLNGADNLPLTQAPNQNTDDLIKPSYAILRLRNDYILPGLDSEQTQEVLKWSNFLLQGNCAVDMHHTYFFLLKSLSKMKLKTALYSHILYIEHFGQNRGWEPEHYKSIQRCVKYFNGHYFLYCFQKYHSQEGFNHFLEILTNFKLLELRAQADKLLKWMDILSYDSTQEVYYYKDKRRGTGPVAFELISIDAVDILNTAYRKFVELGDNLVLDLMGLNGKLKQLLQTKPSFQESSSQSEAKQHSSKGSHSLKFYSRPLLTQEQKQAKILKSNSLEEYKSPRNK